MVPLTGRDRRRVQQVHAAQGEADLPADDLHEPAVLGELSARGQHRHRTERVSAEPQLDAELAVQLKVLLMRVDEVAAAAGVQGLADDPRGKANCPNGLRLDGARVPAALERGMEHRPAPAGQGPDRHR